ncbi:MAG: divalent cation transporter [Candidatus Cloacimonadota bacterium]|nr:MAG: divalent cation transporter [Candidatus Cloacimonadota bacterium]
MILKIISVGFFSGITVLSGGMLSNYFNHHLKESPVKEEINHTLMSFGAGIILSALALVLIPKGLNRLDLIPVSISFLSGTFIFMIIDRYLEKKGGKRSALLAMMMDFVPESIALGAVFAVDHKMALLLAVFIGLQNLPESFNSFRDLVLSGFTPRKTLTVFFFLSFFGVFGTLIGYVFLRDYPDITAYLMTFSGGGILYLLIQDIIPASKMDKHYLVSVGASLGFWIGIIGKKLI